MKRFLSFLLEFLNEDLYDPRKDPSHPMHSTHPEHDLWKHGRPAWRHKENNSLVIGRRGDTHLELAQDHYEKNHENLLRTHDPGIYHMGKKKFHKRSALESEPHKTSLDSLSLMNKGQLHDRGITTAFQYRNAQWNG